MFLIETSYQRFMTRDDEGWFSTRKEKAKRFPTQQEAEDTIKAIYREDPDWEVADLKASPLD